jgi:hypothetical protein
MRERVVNETTWVALTVLGNLIMRLVYARNISPRPDARIVHTAARVFRERSPDSARLQGRVRWGGFATKREHTFTLGNDIKTVMEPYSVAAV